VKRKPSDLGHAPTALGYLPDTSLPSVMVEGELPPPPPSSKDFEARFQPRAELGAGGMGVVRLAYDRLIGRHVALKTMRRELAAHAVSRARFVRELRVQGQLEHPCIVPVYDAGLSEDGVPYFAMRRVRGLTLAEVLSGLAEGDAAIAERFGLRKLLRAFVTVCDAVHYAHSRGVVHRDLKPHNVMLGDFGEVYVLDWGIAQLSCTGEVDASLSLAIEGGAPIGTPGYIPPEGVRVRVDVFDPKTDVYALGAVLFEVLTLTRLWDGDDAPSIVAAQLAGGSVSPRERAPLRDVPRELDEACARALAPRPSGRTASVRELAQAIERFLDGAEDAERKRALAVERGAASLSAAQKATSASTQPAEATAARSEAMQRGLEALALDPAQPAAREALARLLELPKELPPEARAEAHAQADLARLEGARLAMRAFVSWVAVLPLAVAVGVRSWALVGGALAFAFASIALTYWIVRQGTVSPRAFRALLASVAVLVALQCAWLGPFVLLPASAAMSTALFALYSRPDERASILVAGSASVVLPYAAEWVGLAPPSHSFGPQGLVLLPRAFELPPVLTTVGLLYTTLCYVFIPAVLLFRLRDALRTAEDRVFLHAWHLRHALPDLVPAREA
jgi:serine/threonine protein kinase